jgi:polygalacturonase
MPETETAVIEGMVNVREYGAVGDGLTDDSGAVLRAFNEAQSSGKTLYFRPDSII